MRKLVGTISVGAIAATALIASASPAGAAVTLGQLAPGSSPPTDCANPDPYDALQPTVTSGNSYVVPATAGVITSWSHNASSDAGQMLTLKFFRHVAGPTYTVVGHDGPRPITASTINTFSGFSIPVNAGDILGLNDGPPSACAFTVPGDSVLERFGDLADGAQGGFNPRLNVRLNITALLESDCDKDGLGDETQDTNLSTCAPGTTPGTTPTGPPPTLPSGAPATCRGISATMVGTNGSDVRTGSQGQDVIVALGGNDTLSGVADNDVICGGAGKDTLKGGKGKDTLLGQKGRDALQGGPSRDFCKGGKGNDTASKCEVEKSI